MSKRKLSNSDDPMQRKANKKYSLDSDEEDDNDEDANVLDDNDIEGEEEGISGNIGEERYTAFNMQEEMEEGHFDKNGHFIWKNEKEVRDNWLDNIDWQGIKSDKAVDLGKDEKGLGDDSDDSDEEPFHEIEVYKLIITYMKPNETITKSLQRLGGIDKQLSSIERLRRKKAGLLGSNREVTELTELADKVLSKTGNMDIYQETYESIDKKIKNYEGKNNKDTELDMFGDDFDSKEKEILDQTAGTSSDEKPADQIMWEFKWNVKEDKIEGPYNTQQMLKWANEGYFKTGVWARKVGDVSNFYSTNRIDFELYL